MEYRSLGNTGLKVSVLGYGAWVSFSYQASCWFPAMALQVYANGEAERIMGQALKELGYKREEYVLSTKASRPFPGVKLALEECVLSTKRRGVGLGALQACLERLGADHVDVVFAHRPDPSVPMEEVAERLGLIGPAVEQPQYNLFCRQRVEEEYAPLYERWGTGLTIFSPLCSGLLTGKYSGGAVPPDSRMALERYAFLAERSQVAQRHATVDKARSEGSVAGRVWGAGAACREQHRAAEAGFWWACGHAAPPSRRPPGRRRLALLHASLDAPAAPSCLKLTPLAEELGCTLAQLALAWCARNPRVSCVLMGARTLAQLEDNLGALAVLPELTPEVVERIESIVAAGEAAAVQAGKGA
eukprot:scaffold4.g4919.t1